MTDKKGWGSTVAGWFIERDEPAAPAPTDFGDVPEQPLPANLKTTRLHRRLSLFFRRRRRLRPAARLIFRQSFRPPESIRKSNNVSPNHRPAAEFAAGTDAAVKKQIVEASLKAFGVPIEKIIEATVEEIQALDGYIRNGAADNEKLIQESDARIKQYEEEIQNIRSVMQQSVDEQQTLIKVCNDKKLEIQQVLEFFGQDTVAKVVKASPKLHDPSDPAAQAPG